ncbi:hypothetical protein BgiMline_018626, partial [Biomphalaria glabrata]
YAKTQFTKSMNQFLRRQLFQTILRLSQTAEHLVICCPVMPVSNVQTHVDAIKSII